MKGVWTVTIDPPDGEDDPIREPRRVQMSDAMVRQFVDRSDHPDNGIADQLTALKLAELEIGGMF